MTLLGNIVWIICGGLLSAIGWWITGILWCITIVGIPVGVQCFKLSAISLNPFGKEIVNEGGLGSCLLNVLWFFFGGLEMALENLVIGGVLCLTVVGIPFGLQFFKIAKLSFSPFGARVVRIK